MLDASLTPPSNGLSFIWPQAVFLTAGLQRNLNGFALHLEVQPQAVFWQHPHGGMAAVYKEILMACSLYGSTSPVFWQHPMEGMLCSSKKSQHPGFRCTSVPTTPHGGKLRNLVYTCNVETSNTSSSLVCLADSCLPAKASESKP